MNCKRIMMEYGHLPVDALPADVRALVERTPVLHEYWEATFHLRSMLRESEPVDPALAERMVFKVRSRLEQPSRRPEPLLDSVPAGFSAWRWFGLAACLGVAMLGAYRLWMPSPTPMGAPVASAPDLQDPAVIVLPDTVLAATDPGSSLQSVSNIVPRIDIRRNSIDGPGAGLMPVFNPQSGEDRSRRLVPGDAARPPSAP